MLQIYYHRYSEGDTSILSKYTNFIWNEDKISIVKDHMGYLFIRINNIIGYPSEQLQLLQYSYKEIYLKVFQDILMGEGSFIRWDTLKNR